MDYRKAKKIQKKPFVFFEHTSNVNAIWLSRFFAKKKHNDQTNKEYWLSGREFANGLVQSQVESYQRLNTQHYKVRVKIKVEQSKERNSALTFTSMK